MSRPPRPGLPAPYVNPWRLLGRDLIAVAASLRLRVWELWRRNREGSLWTPRFWPPVGAALFWPLLLSLLLVGVTAVALKSLAPAAASLEPTATSAPVSPATPIPSVPAPAAPAGSLTAAAPVSAPATDSPSGPVSPPGPDALAGPDGSTGPDASRAPESPLSPAAPVPEAPGQRDAAAPPLPASSASPASSPSGAAAQVAAQVAAEDAGASVAPVADDEWLGRFRPEDPEGWIVSLTSLPARSCLRLTLSQAFAELPPGRRQATALRWQAAAADLGFERLELVDGQGRRLGRSALVGSGMILLDPGAAS